MANQNIDKKILPAIVDRLRKNESALIAESRALGFTHNGPLRTALRELLGEGEYSALMQSKRPVRVEGAPKVRREGAPVAQRPSDEGLPVVHSMKRSEGWTWRNISEHHPKPVKIDLPEGQTTYLDGGRRLFVVKSPEGVEYVEAHPMEKAHLLLPSTINKDGPPTRMVRWEESSTKARLEKERRQWEGAIEQGGESKDARAEAKALKKAAEEMRKSATAVEAQGRPKDAAKLRKVADAKDATAQLERDLRVGSMIEPKAAKTIAKKVVAKKAVPTVAKKAAKKGGAK